MNSNTILQKRLWMFTCLLILNFGQVFPCSTIENNPPEDGVPRIRLGFEDKVGFHRQLMVAFIEGTTDGYDFGYDGALNEEQLNDAFWLIEQERYVIQAVAPVEDRFNANVGTDIKSGGEITFMIDQLENIPADFQVYIVDNLHGVQHDLREGNYTTYIGVGNFNGRFSLDVVNPSETLSALGFDRSQFQIHYDLHTQKLWLINASDIQIKRLMIYDLLGRMISSRQDNLVQNTIEVPIQQPKGVYIANIETENGQFSKKFIVG